MKTDFAFQFVTQTQDKLYENFNQFYGPVGYLASIPVALLDVTLDVLRLPLITIERLALMAINLVGAAFSSRCSLRDSLFYFDRCLRGIFLIPCKLIMAPIKLICQIFINITDYQNARSTWHLYEERP